MKHLLVFFAFLFFMPVYIHSQDKAEEDNSKTKRVSDIYNYSKSASNYLLLNQVETSSTDLKRNGTNNPKNVTIIQQIGNQNRATSNSISNTSTVNFVQFGNNNFIESSNFISNNTEQIVQNGNNNNVTNFSFGNVKSSSLNILQSGNNLSLEKFGTNSLTNKLSLRVTGNNQTVVIRSF